MALKRSRAECGDGDDDEQDEQQHGGYGGEHEPEQKCDQRDESDVHADDFDLDAVGDAHGEGFAVGIAHSFVDSFWFLGKGRIKPCVGADGGVDQPRWRSGLTVSPAPTGLGGCARGSGRCRLAPIAPDR